MKSSDKKADPSMKKASGLPNEEAGTIPEPIIPKEQLEYMLNNFDKMSLEQRARIPLQVSIQYLIQSNERTKTEFVTMFDGVNKKFDEVNKKFDEVNKKFDENNKKFDEINKKFNKFREEIDDLKHFERNRLELLEKSCFIVCEEGNPCGIAYPIVDEIKEDRFIYFLLAKHLFNDPLKLQVKKLALMDATNKLYQASFIYVFKNIDAILICIKDLSKQINIPKYASTVITPKIGDPLFCYSHIPSPRGSVGWYVQSIEKDGHLNYLVDFKASWGTSGAFVSNGEGFVGIVVDFHSTFNEKFPMTIKTHHDFLQEEVNKIVAPVHAVILPATLICKYIEKFDEFDIISN